jgi:hypothetical protein
VASGKTELGPLVPPADTSGGITCGGLPVGVNPAWVTGVDITINGAIIAPSSITIMNTDTNSHSGSATTQSVFTLDAGSTLPGWLAGGATLFTVSAGTGTVTLGGGASTTKSVTGSATDPTSGVICPITAPAYACFSVASGFFAAYEAGISFTVDTATSLVNTFNGGNSMVTQVTNASATAIVEFDYTVPSGTPEPTTLALMGGALLGLGLLGKRLKKA